MYDLKYIYFDLFHVIKYDTIKLQKGQTITVSIEMLKSTSFHVIFAGQSHRPVGTIHVALCQFVSIRIFALTLYPI